jgi:hypothetical protein
MLDPRASKKITDAAPEEYKLPVEPELPAPVVAASEDESSGAGASDDFSEDDATPLGGAPEASSSKGDVEAGGSKKRKL